MEEIIINANIAKAATSWSPIFQGRKEVNRKIAKVCRATMSIARNKQIAPMQALDEACKINGIEKDEVMEAIEKLGDSSIPKHFSFDGYESIDRIVKPHATSAHVGVPKDWIGCRVAIVLLEDKCQIINLKM